MAVILTKNRFFFFLRFLLLFVLAYKVLSMQLHTVLYYLSNTMYLGGNFMDNTGYECHYILNYTTPTLIYRA